MDHDEIKSLEMRRVSCITRYTQCNQGFGFTRRRQKNKHIRGGDVEIMLSRWGRRQGCRQSLEAREDKEMGSQNLWKEDSPADTLVLALSDSFELLTSRNIDDKLELL